MGANLYFGRVGFSEVGKMSSGLVGVPNSRLSPQVSVDGSRGQGKSERLSGSVEAVNSSSTKMPAAESIARTEAKPGAMLGAHVNQVASVNTQAGATPDSAANSARQALPETGAARGYSAL